MVDAPTLLIETLIFGLIAAGLLYYRSKLKE